MSRGLAGLPRSFWFLVLGMWINRLGAFVLPFLSLYLQERERLSENAASIVLGAWGAGSVLSALVGGQLADRWGRKPTMIFSLTAGALALSGLASVHGLVGLATLAFALGSVAELYRPAVSAAIADLVPSADRARAYGYMIWSFNVAFAISPIVAGEISERAGFTWLFIGDAATMLLAAFLILRAVPETRPVRDAAEVAATPAVERGAALRDPRMRWMLVAAFFLGLVILQSMATLGPILRADGLSLKRYGMVMALNGALIAVAQPWLVPRFEKLGRARVLPWTALLFTVGFAGHALAGGLGSHAACIVVWTAGEIALFPLCNSFVADLAPAHLRGRYLGAYWLAWTLANLVGPPLGLQLLKSGELAWSLLPLAGAIAAPLALWRATRTRVEA
jgi:MFS family permease